MNTSPTTPIAPAQTPARARAAAAAAAGFAGLVGFQIALAVGAPLGHAAWGGTHTYLPAGRAADRQRPRCSLLGPGRPGGSAPRRLPEVTGLVPRIPRRNVAAGRPADPRRAHQLRLPQQLGAFPPSPPRPGHGRAVPGRRAGPSGMAAARHAAGQPHPRRRRHA